MKEAPSRLDGSRGQALGDIKDGLRENKRRADAQREHHKRGLCILPRLQLVVPMIKHLHHRAHQARRQDQPDHHGS